MKTTESIWCKTVDEDFTVEVERIGDRMGRLTVVHDDTEEVLHEEEVTLGVNPLFGIDPDDEDTWKEIALSTIDEFNRT